MLDRIPVPLAWVLVAVGAAIAISSTTAIPIGATR